MADLADLANQEAQTGIKKSFFLSQKWARFDEKLIQLEQHLSNKWAS